MSNPSGMSSVNDLKICFFFTIVNEKGELEVKEKTEKIFTPEINDECMQIPAQTHVKGENGNRVAENGDVYEQKRRKIVRISKHHNEVTDKSKEEKKRAD